MLTASVAASYQISGINNEKAAWRRSGAKLAACEQAWLWRKKSSIEKRRRHEINQCHGGTFLSWRRSGRRQHVL